MTRAETDDERRIEREIDGLFDDFDDLLKNADAASVLASRGVNTSIAMIFADGLRAYLRGDKAQAIEDLTTALEEINQRVAQANQGDA